jgi:glutamine amidotransferase PdxT
VVVFGKRWHSGRLFPLVAVLLLVSGIAVDGTAQTLPALPAKAVDTSYPAQAGATINVPAGGNLQSAINSALPGDTIVLQAGATYTGTFTLPAKSGSGWIVIRTSAPDSAIPAQGRRMTPSYAAQLPKIVTPGSAAAIQTAAGAHHYRLVGLEITVGTTGTNYGLVLLGDSSGAQSSLSQVPHSLILDRVYIHGQNTGNLLRGVAMNSANSAVIDSYISNVHFAGADSQAICGWNGPGPFKITNNYLEGAGENVMFGGADPDISNLVPADIEVRGNHFFKPTAWRGSNWTVKNIFELKNARRVLVEGNIFENNWLAGQNGFSILFTVRNQSGSAPWSVVEDVTFTRNIVRHVAAGINILGNDDLASSQQTKRINISNNLFYDVSSTNWGGSGRFLQMLDGTADITVDHNTAFFNGEVIAAAGDAHQRFTYRNNLTPHNQYGVAGDNYYGNPGGALSTYFPGAVFLRNILQGGTASRYPANNYFPATMNDVGFVNFSGGDYRLASTSPYNDVGTDGKDVGADIDAINTATAGVLSGNSGTTPPPPDTTNPSVSITAPANGATVSGSSTTVSANASDNVGVVSVQFMLDGSPLGSQDTTSPYAFTWNTTTVANGSHALTAVARDAAGNQATASTVTVTVSNATADTTPPVVSITAPASGATVSGTTSITATASDNVGVAGVRFLIDGAPVGTEDTTAPYSVSWETTNASNGAHSLTAIARDATGNSTTSSARTVTVSNAPASQTPYSGSPAAVPGSLQAEDFDRGGEGVAYHDLTAANQGALYRTTEDVDIISPYAGGHVVNNFQTGEWLEYTVNVAQSGTYRIEALVSSAFNGTRFHVEVDGTDKTGPVAVPNTGAWTAFQWTGVSGVTLTSGPQVLRLVSDVEYVNVDALRITATADTSAPAVAISGPANGSSVSGTVQVTATASDNTGVAGVRFLLDGAALGTEDVVAPFSVSWNTTTTSNGTHTLTAVARDAAGNSATSAPVAVTVSNTVPDTTQPTVTVTAPSSGASVNATIQITASASDNIGVTSVRFFVDGTQVGVSDTAAPYAVSWDTTTTTNGAHTLTAVARDAAGNSRTSSAVQVTVANPVPDTTAPAVAITAPTQGTTVSGPVQVSANASDNVGVVGVRFFIDGVVLGAEDTSAPFTSTWESATATNGSHVITAIARDAAGNSTMSPAVSVIVSNTTRKPYKGQPFPVPGRFEAEDFDLGGQAVAYHDTTAGNQSGAYRLGEDVDILSPSAGLYVVNNFTTGEWLSFTINVAQEGTYRLEALVSSAYSRSRLRIEVDGLDRTGTLAVPNTGSWTRFQWVGSGGVSLTAGEHLLKIHVQAEYFNLDSIRLTMESASATSTRLRPARR